MLTEITSNTATATMILPLLGALAITLDVHPMILMAPAAWPQTVHSCYQ